MGLVGIQHQLSLLLHLGGKVCQLCGSGSILDQVDAVECLQGIGVFLALQHRHTALIISKVGAFGQPLDVEHGSQLFVIGGVLVHTVAVVCTCAGVLGTLDGNGERHIANVVGVVTGGLHLHDGPAAQNHGTDLAVIDAGLGALPVGGGGVGLGQAALHCFVQDVVHSVGTHIVRTQNALLERILGLGHGNVHPVRVAGCAAAGVSIPCGHGPAGGVVGVQGINGRIVVLDLLQVIQELVRGLGQGGDAGSLKDLLVVDDALCIAGGRDAVHAAVISAVGSEVVIVLNVAQCAQRLKVVAQLGQGDVGGDHAQITPVVGSQTGGHVVGIVGDALVLDGDVGIQLLECGNVAVEGAVIDEVGAVADDLQLGLQVGVVGADGQLVVSLCTVCAGSGTGGAAGGAGGGSAAAAAGGQSRGCGQHTGGLQEVTTIDLTHRNVLLL